MSEQSGNESAARGPELRAEALVESVTSGNPDASPVVALTGLLGKGSSDSTWRLYLSHQFDEYVEFQATDVVHSQPLDETGPADGTTVWVRAGAHLQYTHVSSRQVQADFLQGGLTTKHLAQTGGTSLRAVGRSETGYACTRNYVCSTNPHIPVCQERTEFCGSLDCNPTGALCPSGAFVC